jgi:hypothetical protein
MTTFSKIDFKTEYEKKYLNGQKTYYSKLAMPRRHSTIYTITSPNNIPKKRSCKELHLQVKNSFETMYFNEFFLK